MGLKIIVLDIRVNMIEKVAIIGSGAWGMALAIHLARENKCVVSLWSAREASRKDLKVNRGNSLLLSGIVLPSQIEISDSFSSAISGAGLLVSAVPSAHLRTVLKTVDTQIPTSLPVLSTTKGLERESFLRPSQTILNVLGPRPVSILSGPSHAEEVARGLPTSLALAGSDSDINLQIQTLFNSESFRVYTNHDILGVEIAGALKNVIAIAAGINDGLGYGDNAKAALITRGLVEMTRYGIACGADAATFNGLAGLGDLIATCTSAHSRNRKVGERLGKGEKLAHFLPEMSQVAEGIFTAPSIRTQALQMNIDLPIIEQVYQVLQNGKNPKTAVQDLMNRAPRKE